MRIRIDSLETEMNENEVAVFSVECSSLFKEIVENAYYQSEGSEGIIYFSDAEGKIDFVKNVEVVVNPFGININSRKVLNKLYQEINSIALEEKYKEYIYVNSSLHMFIQELVDKEPYELDMNDSISIIDMLKLFNVKFDENNISLVEHIIEYINVMHQVLNKRFFIMISIKNYLNKEELYYLYERCIYEKVYLILIENNFHEQIEFEKNFIIDNDLCIIEI